MVFSQGSSPKLLTARINAYPATVNGDETVMITGNEKKCIVKIRFALDCAKLAIVTVTNMGGKTLSKTERCVIAWTSVVYSNSLLGTNNYHFHCFLNAYFKDKWFCFVSFTSLRQNKD